mmetsp:Transcript_33856/g.56831  ORF Transcript_33856/g.56831 Transcript_33856/m.56831 type:complete len:237 (-) Transcript_33856:384-1094(-)
MVERLIGVGEGADIVQPDQELGDVPDGDEEPVEHKELRYSCVEEDQAQHKVGDDRCHQDAKGLHHIEVRAQNAHKSRVTVKVGVQLRYPVRHSRGNGRAQQQNRHLNKGIGKTIFRERVCTVRDLLHHYLLLQGERRKRDHTHVTEKCRDPNDAEHTIQHVFIVVRDPVVGDAEEKAHESVEHEAEGVHRGVARVQARRARQQRHHPYKAEPHPLVRASKRGCCCKRLGSWFGPLI